MERSVERRYLAPVRRLGSPSFVVQRGDGGLELIGPDRPSPHGGFDEECALGDRRSIPQVSILFVQRDGLSLGGGARPSASVGKQHQRQEPHHLWILGEATL